MCLYVHHKIVALKKKEILLFLDKNFFMKHLNLHHTFVHFYILITRGFVFLFHVSMSDEDE